ncbi:MAG: WYL domain-containing protein [Roseburia sp.]|nr:WYL domain-containing protein [Roseburia sp.]
MELFSEIYNCYFQVLRRLLQNQNAMTIQEIQTEISDDVFGESLLSIIPKIEDGTWNLFQKQDGLYLSKLGKNFSVPLSHLQKSYLKALLSDPRIRLFLEPEQFDTLKEMLKTVNPLWTQEQFYYYDRFADGDPYDDEKYRCNFRTLLQAQKCNQFVDIDYTSPRGTRVHHHYVPCRLEYSVKNDKFRLLAIERTRQNKMKLEILNVSRIQQCTLMDEKLAAPPDLNQFIRSSYYREPLKLRIVNERNALERAMLHFANYEKNTTKIDENTYECLIYYNQSMETELLIEVMSFGPMLTVLGNEHFLNLIKSRLRRQMNLFSPEYPPKHS